MRQSEVKIGGEYRAKVSGGMTTVRVDAVRKRSGYGGRTTTVFDCTNLRTGKKLVGWTAAKLRGPADRPLDGATVRKYADAIKRGHWASPGVPLSTRPTDDRTAHEVQVDDETGHGEVDFGGFKPGARGEQGPDPTPAAGASTAAAPSSPLPTSARPAAANSPPDERAAAIRGWSIGGMPVAPSLNAVIEARASRPGASYMNGAAPHVEVQALAGTGKTTCMVEGLVEVKAGGSKLTPSPEQRAVWDQLRLGRSESVRLSAFNNAITTEAGRKLEAAGLARLGVEAKGIHALGKYVVCRAFPELKRFDLKRAEWVVKDRAAEALGGNYQDLRKAGKGPLMHAAAELVGLCKQTLTDPTREGLDALTSRHDVDLEGTSRREVYDLVPRVLDACRRPDGRYDFNDMLWLPHVHGLKPWRVDLQIIDESQDLNRAQQELMYSAGHRIVFVGDRHQAIYGFAGADAESMDRMRRRLAGGPEPDSFEWCQAASAAGYGSDNPPPDGWAPPGTRGLVTLPLTVTRRCGRAIVEEARRFVPEYAAHESNPDGVVARARYTSSGTGGERREVPWEKTYGPLVRPGAMVLCRCNAPLVSQCFKFLARDIPAHIQGRKIGDGLLALVNKSKAETVKDLVVWMGAWLEREQGAEAAKPRPSETKLEALQDRHDCVLAFCENEESVDRVRERIGRLFSDSPDNPGVKFSTGHKAKGLEADQVFILEPAGVGPRLDKMQAWERQQEDNVRYVMVTRAIKELTYVS